MKLIVVKKPEFQYVTIRMVMESVRFNVAMIFTVKMSTVIDAQAYPTRQYVRNVITLAIAASALCHMV